MATIFYIIGFLALVYGLAVNAMASSAIHEIEGFIVLLISAILIVGATLVDQLHRLLARVEHRQKAPVE